MVKDVLSDSVLQCPVPYCIVHCQVLFCAVQQYCILHIPVFHIYAAIPVVLCLNKYTPMMLQQELLCQTLDAVRFMAVFESVYSIHNFNMLPLGIFFYIYRWCLTGPQGYIGWRNLEGTGRWEKIHIFGKIRFGLNTNLYCFLVSEDESLTGYCSPGLRKKHIEEVLFLEFKGIFQPLKKGVMSGIIDRPFNTLHFSIIFNFFLRT